MENIAKKGSKVSVEYEGRFEDGEIFDSSSHGDHSHPLEFEVGTGQVIKGFDNAVDGMKINEEKEIVIEPKEGYGEINDKAVQEVPRKALPKDQNPEEGMTLILSTPDGHKFPAKIKKVTKEKVVIDLNHPLAGKKLLFKIKLIEIS
jgi:FKBP-type peptidyl-prolyl cis-trans isomerase 2